MPSFTLSSGFKRKKVGVNFHAIYNNHASLAEEHKGKAEDAEEVGDIHGKVANLKLVAYHENKMAWARDQIRIVKAKENAKHFDRKQEFRNG